MEGSSSLVVVGTSQKPMEKKWNSKNMKHNEKAKKQKITKKTNEKCGPTGRPRDQKGHQPLILRGNISAMLIYMIFFEKWYTKKSQAFQKISTKF